MPLARPAHSARLRCFLALVTLVTLVLVLALALALGTVGADVTDVTDVTPDATPDADPLHIHDTSPTHTDHRADDDTSDTAGHDHWIHRPHIQRSKGRPHGLPLGRMLLTWASVTLGQLS